jgi:formylglycine-generating enzyme
VTAGQYCALLNAVATKSDPYGLYNTNMNTDNYSTGCNIRRSVVTGGYQYTVAADWANRPVNFVSWGDAARFVNWLENGQKTGYEDASTTEIGTYALNGANNDAVLASVLRNPNAQYVLPNFDEWYKAAFFDPNKNGLNSPGYWKYPTKSNARPINVWNPAGTNNANFFDELGTGTGSYTIGDPYYRTEVGAFVSSVSPYSTYDQGGNVVNWNETAFSPVSRGVAGDAFDGPGAISKWSWNYGNPTWEDAGGGFRIASLSVPEPGILTMLLLCFAAGFVWWIGQK